MFAAVPPLIPGSQVLSSLRVNTIEIDKLVNDSIDKVNTWKGNVVAATTVDINLDGIQTIDGVVLVDGDLVLVKDQTLPVENGIYVVNSLVWERYYGLPVGSDASGVAVFVTGGTVSGSSIYVQVNNAVVGTDDLAFVVGGSGGGVPSGLTGTLQYNNAGALGGVLGSSVAVDGKLSVVSLAITPKANYTQVTSDTTAVPITTRNGAVTTFTLTTATASTTVFTLTGSQIVAGDSLFLTVSNYSGTIVTNGVPLLYATSVVDGTATITVLNGGANAMNGTMTFNYMFV